MIDTLASGLTVLRIPMEGLQSITVMALVNAGSRYEQDAQAGISHFLEHMVFKGTQRYPTAQVLSEAIDQVGGVFNAFTSKEYTGYYVKLASRDAHLALDVVTDMLCVPQLRQEDVTRESTVIIEEINMYEDLPMDNVGEVFEDLMFEGNNLARRILGSKETVGGMQADQLRAYIHQWYGFKNVVLVVAGDAAAVNDAGLLATIDEMTKKGGADRQADPHESYWTKVYGHKRKSIVFKKTEQAHFVFGFPGYHRTHPNRYQLAVLSTLLGKTMSSRLFLEIREKRGLCYYVRSNNDVYHDTGVFGASAGVDPKRVEEAIAATRNEFFALLGERPVTDAEVQAAKQNIIGRLLLDMEDSQSVAVWNGMRQLLEGQVQTLEEVIASVEAVTRSQVDAVAHELIKPDELRFALIGPFQESDIKSV